MAMVSSPSFSNTTTGLAEFRLDTPGPSQVEHRFLLARRGVGEVVGQHATGQILFRHPVVQGLELRLLFFAADPPDDRTRRRRDGRLRASQPAGVAVQELFHPLVDFGREQYLAGFKKVAEVLDPPKHGIHGDPLRGQRARVRLFDLREIRRR